jgi:hypothetical protein
LALGVINVLLWSVHASFNHEGGKEMRIERIARDKVKIFISYEDLEERGIDKNEIWQTVERSKNCFGT